MAYDEELAERIRNLMKTQRGVTERKMMGGLTFMTASGMFCSASGKGGLLVRVEPDSRDRFLAERYVQPADMSGRRMTGFIRVMPEGYRTKAGLKKWVERGLAAASARTSAGPKRARNAASKTGRAKRDE